MKLLIDAAGGIAGDMISAALLALGADEERVFEAMETVGGSLGQVNVALETLPDGVRRLRIHLENNDHHLAASQARNILGEGFERLVVPDRYRECGMRALEILIEAEAEAHSLIPGMDEQIHRHRHTHGIHHHHDESHHRHDETFLHEAQDIVLDICGVMTALWSLDLAPQIELIGPVAVGGGTVSFSHGVLPVPAPAVRIILEKYTIPWNFGPIEQELCTPTGAALLAAMNARKTRGEPDLDEVETGRSRGTRPYDVPPLTVYRRRGFVPTFNGC